MNSFVYTNRSVSVKICLLCLLSSLAFAGENKDHLFSSTTHHLMEKVVESNEFSPSPVMPIENDPNLEVVEDEDVEAMPLNHLEVECKNSLEEVFVQTIGHVVIPQEEEEVFESIQPQFEDLHFLQSPVELGAVQFASNAGESIDPYETLPISFEEKQKIAELLITMAENNVFQLLFQRKHLEHIGHEIRHVHPMRFLGTVFSDPRLLHCMRRIRQSSFKWDGFIDGYVERIKQEARTNNLSPHIPGLAKALNLDPKDIERHINQKDYEGFIVFLIENVRRN